MHMLCINVYVHVNVCVCMCMCGCVCVWMDVSIKLFIMSNYCNMYLHAYTAWKHKLNCYTALFVL